MPWVFCVIEGVQRIAAYGERAKEDARDHLPDGRRAVWTDDPEFKAFWDAPLLVLICGRQGHPEAALDCCRAGPRETPVGKPRPRPPIHWCELPGGSFAEQAATPARSG